MNKEGRGIWIIGIIIASVLCVLMMILFMSALSQPKNNDDTSLSIDELSAHCYRASELFCAGVYYTDKALSANPQDMSYNEWQQYVKKADEYWDALEDELDLIEDYADTNEFEDSFEDTEIKAEFYKRLTNILVPTAHAIDTTEILRTYNGAEAGNQLQAVADYLGKDLQYAKSALKVATGELNAQKWNDVADTMYVLESAARITKTAAQGTLLVIGAPAAGTAALSLQGATFAVSGASMIWQVVDDGCFIAMGDSYDNNEFVASLNSIKDAAATINFASGMLSMNFSSFEDAAMSGYDFAENMRGLFQDGKIAGIQLTGKNGNIISLTKDELLEYRQAKENGQNLPDEIAALLKMLDGNDNKPEELTEYVLTADRTTIMIDEWVTFTVNDTKPEYTYIWKYGSNKNPQDSNAFSYMYQVAGTYTMYVTVLDKDGEAVGKGSCTVEVMDTPTPTPDNNAQPTSAPVSNNNGDINIVGTYAYSENGDYYECSFYEDGSYTSTDRYSDSDFVYQTWGTYTLENVWHDEDSGKTYYKYFVDITQTSNGTEGVDYAPNISSDDMDSSGNVQRINDYIRK